MKILAVLDRMREQFREPAIDRIDERVRRCVDERAFAPVLLDGDLAARIRIDDRRAPHTLAANQDEPVALGGCKHIGDERDHRLLVAEELGRSAIGGVQYAAFGQHRLAVHVIGRYRFVRRDGIAREMACEDQPRGVRMERGGDHRIPGRATIRRSPHPRTSGRRRPARLRSGARAACRRTA